MRFSQFFLLMLLFLFLSTTLAICAEDSVTVVIRRKDDAPHIIKDLTFDVLSAHLVSRPDGIQEVFVIAKMVFSWPDNWLVRTTMKPTPIRPNEPFLLMARFQVPIEDFILTAVGPNGEQSDENFVVVSVIKKKRSKFQTDLFLGVSQTNYEEELRTKFKQTSLAAGFNLTYFLSRRNWSIKGDVFSDVAIIDSNATTYSAKFFMAGGQLDYALPPMSAWRLKLSLGLSSPVMLGTQGKFGYSTLFIPRLYPSITKLIGMNAIYGYFRYMPLGPAEEDSGFGLGMILNTPDRRRLIFALDYSYLQFRPKITTIIRTDSLSFRVGCGY